MYRKVPSKKVSPPPRAHAESFRNPDLESATAQVAIMSEGISLSHRKLLFCNLTLQRLRYCDCAGTGLQVR